MSALAVTMAGSLPPSSRKQGISRSRAGQRDLAAVRHAAGEADEIGLRDDFLARTAVTQHDVEYLRELRHVAHGLHERLDEARRHFARLQQHGGAGEQRRNRIEQRQHHRRVPRTDDADERIRHELRANLHGRHRDRLPAHLRFREHGLRVFAPAADVRDGDERGELRGVAAAGICAIRRADDLGVRDQLPDPAAHDADALRDAAARPTPSDFGAGARPSARPPATEATGKAEIGGARARIAHQEADRMS